MKLNGIISHVEAKITSILGRLSESEVELYESNGRRQAVRMEIQYREMHLKN